MAPDGKKRRKGGRSGKTSKAAPPAKKILHEPSQGRLLPTAGVTVGGGLLVLMLFLAGAFMLQEQPPEEGMVAVSQVQQLNDLAVDPGDPSIVWLATPQGIIRLSEGRLYRMGDAWRSYSLVIVDDGEGPIFYASGQGSGDQAEALFGLRSSADRGRTWESIALNDEGILHLLTSSRDESRVFYGWDYTAELGFQRSLDGGVTWEALDPELEEALYTMAAHPTDPDYVIGGSDEGLFVSRDGGSSWDPGASTVRGNIVTAVAVHPTDSDRQYAYMPGFLRGLMISTDGGDSWRQMGLRLDEGDVVVAIAAAPGDPDVVYAATWEDNIWHTSDGGQTWQKVLEDREPVRSR